MAQGALHSFSLQVLVWYEVASVCLSGELFSAVFTQQVECLYLELEIIETALWLLLEALELGALLVLIGERFEVLLAACVNF